MFVYRNARAASDDEGAKPTPGVKNNAKRIQDEIWRHRAAPARGCLRPENRHVNRAKYRKRGTSIDGYIDGLGHFASAALSRGSRIGGCMSGGLRSPPKPIAHP